jgi:hypothetical protein
LASFRARQPLAEDRDRGDATLGRARRRAAAQLRELVGAQRAAGASFMCTPAMACIEAPMACTGDGTCCDGLACAPAPNAGEPTNPPPTRCCSSAGTSCGNDFDCCGEMLCVDGECSCQSEGSLCYSDQDCCDGFGCVGGNCVDVTDCRRPGQGCTSLGDCCGIQICGPESFGGTDTFCGVGEGERCQEDTECIGSQTCVDGACQSVRHLH